MSIVTVTGPAEASAPAPLDIVSRPDDGCSLDFVCKSRQHDA